MIRWPQSRTRAERFDRLDSAAAGLDPDRASDRAQHRPASSLCRKPPPLGRQKGRVSSSSPHFGKAPAERTAQGVGFLGCSQVSKTYCAEIAEADPILLKSSKMRARDREIACRQICDSQFLHQFLTL